MLGEWDWSREPRWGVRFCALGCGRGGWGAVWRASLSAANDDGLGGAEILVVGPTPLVLSPHGPAQCQEMT
jgi:hypothetical protein